VRKIRKSELEAKAADLAENIGSTNGNLLEEIISQADDDGTGEAKMIKKLIGSVAGRFLLPQSLCTDDGENTTINLPQVSTSERLSLSLRWLRVLQDAAETQRRSIMAFLEASKIDLALIDSAGFNETYNKAESLALERMPDESLYRARYRRCQKSGCSLCATGPGHGPYWYRVSRQGKRVVTSYLGKTLPPQALGFANPQERYKFLLAEALKELLNE